MMKKCFTCARKKATYVAFIVKTILLFICLSTYSYKVAAQPRFPVSSRSIIKPPYSNALSDYYTGTDPRLQLVLMNMDITQPVIKARLRLNIISNRINLRSREFIGPIVELDAGTPQYLSGMDLSVYFNPNNIDVVSGLDYNALFKTPALPDGTYTFRFDVIEAFTGRILNNIYENQSTINILRCEPPFLNLPRKGDNIRYTDPLNIVFNWTPRALIKGMTEYEFSLYEINDNGMPPENAPFMSQPIYQTTTNTTTFLYSPTEPPLLPGKKYAWRVKAIAKQGIDSYSLYTNNGYTETYWFQLQDNCDPIQQISATVRNGAVTLEWPDNLSMYGYTVEYWKKGDWNRHFSTTTKNNKVIITDVAPGNTYEYRVGGTCTVGAGATYSDIRAFTIPPRDSIRDKQCGILGNINLSNQKILDNLNAGETVMVGDFPVTLLSVMANGNGSFSGTAAVKMDIFSIAEAKVKAKFDNVVFNTDKQLIKGFMVTTYDSTEKQVVDLDEVMEGGGDVGKIKDGRDTANVTVPFPIHNPTDINVHVNPDDSTITIQITGPNGEIQQPKVDKLPLTIKDSEGTIYNVDKDGKVTKVGKSGEFKGLDFKQFNTIATNKATVTFIAHPEQQYAFDAWKDIYNNSQLFQAEYEKLTGYRVSSKAIEAAKTDVVKATIKINDNSIKPDSVRFVTGKGTRYESKYLGNNEYEITVVGGPSKDAQELYAIYPISSPNVGGQVGAYLSFGKLLISSYPHKKQKLVLVPVNGAPVDKNKIADSLNAIYKKVAVEFEVLQDVNFEDHSWDKNGDGLDVEGSGLFSTLTNDMKALNKAYRDSKRPIDKSTIYLFVLSKASQQGVVGDMPRNKQFGYLFTGNDGKTVAHEVGHGLFNLKHTFDSQYGFAKGGLGNNVMDYPNGNQFSKLQWDAIHDPGLVIGLFEGDGDAMLENQKSLFKCLYQPIQDVLKKEKTFYAPNGEVVDLPQGAVPTKIFYKDLGTKNTAKQGSLAGFDYNGQSYSVWYSSNDRAFVGYSFDSDNTHYRKSRIKKPSDNIVDIQLSKDDASTEIKINGQSYSSGVYQCQNANYTLNYNKFSRVVRNAQDPVVKQEIESFCKTLASIPRDVLETHNELFHFYYNNRYLDFVNVNTPLNSLSLEDLKHLHQNIKDLNANIEQFKKCQFSTADDIIAFVNDRFVIEGSWFSYISKAQFKALSKTARVCLIEKLLQGSFGQRYGVSSANFGGQNIAIEILKNCSNQKDFYEVIIQLKTDGKLYDLLAKMYDYLYFSEGNFTELCLAITNVYLSEVKSGLDDAKIASYIKAGKWMIFDNGYLTSRNKEDFDDASRKIKLEISDGAFKQAMDFITPAARYLFKGIGESVAFNQSFEPLEEILFIPKRDIEALGTVLKKGQPYILPAITVYLIFKIDTKAAIGTSAEIALNIALCEVGIGAFTSAGTAVTTLQTTDIAVSSFVTYANSAPEIYQDHPQFTQYLNYLAWAYTIGRIGYETYQNVKVKVPVNTAGRFSDELLEAWSKFDDNVLDVASVGKQNWKTFQNRVAEQLQSLHPGKKIGNQITLDVTYVENGITKTKTIIPDNLIEVEVNGIKKYKVIDAKTAQTDLVNKADLTSTCTQNQQPIYKMIDGDATAGTITKVEMRGGQAEQAFGISFKTQIQLESGVEFWVNTNNTDFTQYLIRPRIK